MLAPVSLAQIGKINNRPRQNLAHKKIYIYNEANAAVRSLTGDCCGMEPKIEKRKKI